MTPPLIWMAAAGTVSCWLITRAAGAPGPEIASGMAAPLVAAAASWVAYARAHARAPDALTRVMVGALVLKMAFFGAYVVVMVRVVGLRAEPFVVSFAGYFVALHAMEAWFLRRLLTSGAPAPDGGHR